MLVGIAGEGRKKEKNLGMKGSGFGIWVEKLELGTDGTKYHTLRKLTGR